MKTFFLVSILIYLNSQFAMADNPAQAAPPAPVEIPAGTPATPPTDPAKFEIFLLVGQSNMAGRAPVLPEDKVADPRVLILDHTDAWVTEGEPIHFDKPKVNGVGPGYTFGKLVADKEPGVTIGLIPCAFGGTGLNEWDPKSKDTKLYPPDSLYGNAIRRAQIAMKAGTLKAIIWHQGESDAGKFADQYATKLAKLVAQMRTDLHAPNVPFLAGEIGYFGYAAHPAGATINQQINTLPTVIPNCAVVSAKDLVDKGDHLHFDNASQKTLAKRYFEAYEQIQSSATASR